MGSRVRWSSAPTDILEFALSRSPTGAVLQWVHGPITVVMSTMRRSRPAGCCPASMATGVCLPFVVENKNSSDPIKMPNVTFPQQREIQNDQQLVQLKKGNE